MIACYVRVSTKRQRTDSQRAEIKRWLDGNGIDLSTVVWFEDKETGKTLCRPAFEKLQKAVFNGQVKTVVVWKLDRLSRSLRDGVNVLADWCERGVRVVSTTQGVDLSGPVGRMVAALLLGVAEIELEYRRERQAAGIRVAKKCAGDRQREAGQRTDGVSVSGGRRARSSSSRRTNTRSLETYSPARSVPWKSTNAAARSAVNYGAPVNRRSRSFSPTATPSTTSSSRGHCHRSPHR